MKQYKYIQDEMMFVNDQPFWKRWLKTQSKACVSVFSPKYEFTRANVFLDDLRCEYGIVIRLEELCNLLLTDSLQSIRHGINLSKISKDLMRKREHYLTPPKRDDLQQVEDNRYVRTSIKDYNYPRLYKFDFYINRADAVRGEFFLCDIQRKVDPHFDVTLNQLVSIIFLDFVKAVEEGHSAKMLTDLYHRLSQVE